METSKPVLEAFIKERLDAGKSVYTIQKELEESGHTNPVTGRPVSYAGVDYMVKKIRGIKIKRNRPSRAKKVTLTKKRAPRTTQPTTLGDPNDPGKLETVAQILTWAAPADKKLAAIRIVLG